LAAVFIRPERYEMKRPQQAALIEIRPADKGRPTSALPKTEGMHRGTHTTRGGALRMTVYGIDYDETNESAYSRLLSESKNKCRARAPVTPAGVNSQAAQNAACRELARLILRPETSLRPMHAAYGPPAIRAGLRQVVP